MIRKVLDGQSRSDSVGLGNVDARLRQVYGEDAALVGELKLFVPLEGLVDLDAERVRLDKELKRVDAEIARCNGKLGSATFVANAPAAVVEQERQRLADWTAQRDGLAAQRARL